MGCWLCTDEVVKARAGEGCYVTQREGLKHPDAYFILVHMHSSFGML